MSQLSQHPFLECMYLITIMHSVTVEDFKTLDFRPKASRGCQSQGGKCSLCLLESHSDVGHPLVKFTNLPDGRYTFYMQNYFQKYVTLIMYTYKYVTFILYN